MRDDLLEITAKLTRFVKKSFCLPLPKYTGAVLGG